MLGGGVPACRSLGAGRGTNRAWLNFSNPPPASFSGIET
jgi:hypothetical protein